MRPSPLSPYLAATASASLCLACIGREGTGAHDASGGPGAHASNMRTPDSTPAGAGAGGGAPRTGASDREFLRAFAATRGFRLGAPQHMLPTPDGKSVLFLRATARDPRQSLYELEIGTGTTRRLVAPESLLGEGDVPSAAERALRERLRIITQGITDYELSDDGTLVAFVLSGRLFIHSRETGQTREISTGKGPISGPRFSPDGRHIAYVRGHDVHAAGLDGSAEAPVTQGGTETRTHGEAEFVAAEELGRSRGFWFSPDGAHVVYEEADISKVELLTIADPAHPERAPDRNPYPRAGRTNADVRLGIVPSRGGPTTWIAWDRARFPYVANVTWSEGAPLTVYVLDRLQKNGALLAVDPHTGKTSTLLEEHDDAWLNLDQSVPRWLPGGGGFLWSSERSGGWALELRDPKGALVREVVPKGVGYRGLAHVDPVRREIVVVASDEPTEAGVYAAPLDGGTGRWLLPAHGAMYSAHFGRGHEAFAVTETTATTMPRMFVRTVSDPQERPIPSVAEAPAIMPGIEIARVGADQVRVGIVRPRGFSAGKRYPVIDAAYGGPGFNVVGADAQRFLRAQWIADVTGAIVVGIDAQGTPFRGRAWERALRGKLGSVPLDGHVAALQALGAKYPEMDLTRVGVYGWSFGGYFSALAALTRPDVYKVAVAGASPVDWRDYDTAYTERYLGLPGENGAGYDTSSLLPRTKTASAIGHLLLIHGTADDNVYFFNTLKLVDALERAGHPFEFWPLAGITHMLIEPDVVEAVWVRTAEFLKAGLGEPAKP